MRRVVVLGRGGAGKSTFAGRLGVATGLPVVELDRYFWGPDLAPTPRDRWASVQHDLTAGAGWILDGDLAHHDALEVRLRRADTIVVLDFSLWRCAWRAVRRSRANAEFWRWVIHYRRRGLPPVRAAIADYAPGADVYTFHTPRALERFLERIEARSAGRDGAE